jgi:hypothetical protein
MIMERGRTAVRLQVPRSVRGTLLTVASRAPATS